MRHPRKMVENKIQTEKNGENGENHLPWRKVTEGIITAATINSQGAK